MIVKDNKRAKAHKLLRNTDLSIDVLDYNESFLRALNYLNSNYSTKQYREWVAFHYPKAKFGDHGDFQFRTLGSLCRLLDSGSVLSDEHIAKMESEFTRLTVEFVGKTSKVKTVDKEVTVTNAPSIQEAMDKKVSEFMAEFNGVIDQYTTDRTMPKVASLITNMGIKGPMLKKVAEKVNGTIEELRETIAGTDKQLVEGYSNFKKVELRKLLGIYEELISSLSQAKVAVVRKTRVVKVKPPGIVAKSVKYKKEDTDNKLVSMSPVRVIGNSEVWIFNAKYRKLQVYEAQDGMTLTFKGSTLLNFDIEKSYAKTVRKPEQLQTLLAKKSYSQYMKAIKGATGRLTGRLNDECIILAVFK